MTNRLSVNLPPQIVVLSGGVEVEGELSFEDALRLVGALSTAGHFYFWARLDIVKKYRKHGQSEAFARRMGWRNVQTLYNWVSVSEQLKPEHRNMYLTPSHNKAVIEIAGVDGEMAREILDEFEFECHFEGRMLSVEELKDFVRSKDLPVPQVSMPNRLPPRQEWEIRERELEQQVFNLSNSLAYAQAKVREVMPHLNGEINTQELRDFVEDPLPSSPLNGRWVLGGDGVYFQEYEGELHKYPDMPPHIIEQLKIRLSIT